MPANAGIQHMSIRDSRLRGNDSIAAFDPI